MVALRLTLLSALFTAASLSTSAARASTTLEFSYHRGLIWIEAKIAGQDRELNFLLDTGAEQSVIDHRAARKGGVRFVGREVVTTVHGNQTAFNTDRVSLHLGRASTWTAPLLALDLSAESRNVGRRIDGLLGMDFLKGRVVQIDYPSKVVRLDISVPSQSGRAVPIVLHRGNPCVRVKVDGSFALPRVRLDTGCAQALHWSPPATAATGTDSRTREIGLSPIRRPSNRSAIALGRFLLEDVSTTLHPSAIFSGEQGLLGNPLLARFGVITIDLSKRQLILGSR